jgi:GAF domain-containing protein/anti-sigma regulatory factor (Ser/Thr protein kinase)
LGGRTVIERRLFHIRDLQAEVDEFPEGSALARERGHRTTLSVPLVREDVAIGNIQVRRDEVRPFSEQQIVLLQTFADQAVIAIENVRLFQELKESLEQQTATSEILGVIASSPTDIQPVLDTIAESAARVCNANDASIRLAEGNMLRLAAHHGPIPMFAASELPIDRDSVAGRAVVERQRVHIDDLLSVTATEFPRTRVSTEQEGDRTVLAVPLMREDVPIGAIIIRRTEVRPFSEKQIGLLETFADQAVIAIENVRLFQELQARNHDLTEALEQQTATSEILRVISGSPTDIQPVMDTIATNAARLCEASDVHIHRIDGDILRLAASYGNLPASRDREITRQSVRGRAVVDRKTIHIHDFLADAADYSTSGVRSGARTLLATPLVREGVPIGVIAIRRMEVRPFSDKQIKLLETFADQAVIAIENVRLFQELKESLEQQTATSEILGVIASSPTNIQPVLDTIAASAARICGANDALIRLLEGNVLRLMAHHGSIPSFTQVHGAESDSLDRGRGWIPGRAVLDRETVHIHDISAVENELPETAARARRSGVRTALATPLLREGTAIGVIFIRRTEVKPFTDKQIALLKTFADQAVIAIENVRLFQELQVRNRDLTEALEQQTATSEVLRVISSSPTDVQPVFDAIVQSATRLCDASFGMAHRFDGQLITLDSHQNVTPEQLEQAEQRFPAPATRASAVGRAILECKIVHIEDIRDDPEYVFVGEQRALGYRTVLAVPLLREGTPIGVLGMWRREVKPFTENQIKLLKTFADQAVIAIENVRLFKELQERNRDLTEALEQQTATSEILRVIASSPTDIQPVLDVVAENAARLCDAVDAVITRPEGDALRVVAKYGTVPVPEILPLSRGFPAGRAVIERQTIHVRDIAAEIDSEYPEARLAQQLSGTRTVLNTPLLREGIAIGGIGVRRTEVRPFSEKQIALLKIFADQAVIAIENVRLFNELDTRNRQLTEALDQQTATSEVLKAISRSTFELEPVLHTLLENATRLCGADHGSIHRVEGEMLPIMAAYRHPDELTRVIEQNPPRVSRDTVTGRVVLERQPIHIPNLMADPDYHYPVTSLGLKTVLGVPLLREGAPIGVIIIFKTEVEPFTDKQIELVTTFADQAVIAIENTRLFKELQDRNDRLTESLEQQTATSEILRVIASSPTDVQPVLDVVAENAARLCDATDAVVSRVDGSVIKQLARYGAMPVPEPNAINRNSPVGRAIVDRTTIHVTDLVGEIETEYPESKTRQLHTGTRTILVAPLLREGVAIGTINIRRTEVRPFSEKQIKLLETFADQAVIAIENVRLFNELDTRNHQLTEALEQQTATSEILRVIASSPTDIKPVLDTVAERAARLCDAVDAQIWRVEGDRVRFAAQYGSIPSPRIEEGRPIIRGVAGARAILDRETIHIPDTYAPSIQTEFPDTWAMTHEIGIRTLLATPLLREGTALGYILIRRLEARPFSDKQIALLKTFADQAVIAIENVRLFQELQERTRELVESVEELKALGEVGQAVSSSLDLETVLETIVARAVDLSGTDCGVIYEFDDAAQEFNLRASHRMEAEAVEALRAARIRAGEGAAGQAAMTRAPVQIADTLDQRERSTSRIRPLLNRLGYRSLLTVPLLREQQILGGLTVWRRQVGEFEPEVVNLLQTFATQSALAIHNARLFREIGDKSRELEAANRHKSEFLANVSHELRTPLNAIIGFSEVLLEKLFGELNDKQNEYVDDILSSGRHLLSLINDILDLSKIEAGRMELEVTTFHLPDAIENALLLVRERASRHGIKLERVIDDRLGDFTGDERKVKQVLVNLLSNAVKFTPEGGQIKVEARLGDRAVIMSVADNGIGIAPEDQEAIFEEFRQVGSNYAHKREGTGLGLSLTRKFVELHDGKIWVESEPGKGSKFTFTLPVK